METLYQVASPDSPDVPGAANAVVGPTACVGRCLLAAVRHPA